MRFTLSMDRSPSFGSNSCNTIALFRLAFATTTLHRSLILLHKVSHRLIMQKARSHACSDKSELSTSTACRLYGFRDYFTSLTGELFTFPSQYCFTIGCQVVFSLRKWSSSIPTGLGYPVVLGDNIQEAKSLSFTGLLPSLVALFQRPLTRDLVFNFPA